MRAAGSSIEQADLALASANRSSKLAKTALDLVTTLSSDGQWLPPLPSTALDGSAPHPGGALLWVDGHLRLQGALTSGWHTPASAAEPSSPAVHALVMGDAQVHCALLRQGQLHVQGNLSVHTLMWGDGAPGGLTVLGQCAAQVGLFTRGYALQWFGLSLTVLIIYCVLAWRAWRSARAG